MQIEIPTVVASLSLCISSIVAWFTLFRRGQLQMTNPSMIGLCVEQNKLKIFFTSMLYSTGRKGHIVESIFLKVRHTESLQIFNHWSDFRDGNFVSDAGLKVGEDGVCRTLCFVPSLAGANFGVLIGKYEIEVLCKVANCKRPKLLSTLTLELSSFQASAVQEGIPIAFQWGPASKSYHSVDQKLVA